jgi:N-terminal acetyltransferase B complex non-catalytic subunit
MAVDGTTVDLQDQNIKILENEYDGEVSPLIKKSEVVGVFPNIHGDTVDINAHDCDASPLPSFDNGGLEDSINSASHTGRSRIREHTPENMSGVIKVYNRNQMNSSEFKLGQGRKLISKTVCDITKRNLEEEMDEEQGKLKVQLVQAQIENNNLNAQNLEIKRELEVYIKEREDLICAFNEQRNRYGELEEYIRLLEQQLKDPNQVVLLRGKALENAKTEIAQLRINLQDKDKENMKLKKAVNDLEREQRTQETATFKQIKELCGEVQKYKLLITATKRQMQELKDNNNTCLTHNKDSQAQFEQQVKELNDFIRKLQEEKDSLLSSIKEHKLIIEEERKINKQLSNDIKDLKVKYEKQFNELNEAKVEIEQYGEHKVSIAKSDYGNQIQQMKEQYSKKLQAVNEELVKVRAELEKKEYKIVEYEDRLKEVEVDCVVEELKQVLQVSKEDLQRKVEELLAESEENKILKEQQLSMEHELKESQKVIEDLKCKSPIIEKQEEVMAINSTARNEELVKVNERLKESKDIMQIQLSNISETLKIKDQEITLLTKSRDVAESNEKAIRAEMEKLTTDYHTLINFIDNIKNTFADREHLITDSMTIEEKVSLLNDYLLSINKRTEVKQVVDELPNKINEVSKLRELLTEERTHSAEILEQMKEMHRVELEALSASKNAIVNQLQEKVQTLTDKLAHKKKKIGEMKEMMLENENLKKSITQNVKVDEGKISKLEEVIDTMKEDLVNKDEIIAKLKNSLKDKPKEVQQESEKALKLMQQRLLQSYEENNEKINELKDKLKSYKDKIQVLEAKNKELEAECKNLKLIENISSNKQIDLPLKSVESLKVKYRLIFRMHFIRVKSSQVLIKNEL